MKIVLATCGSRGDVQPMIALCLALKSAGHTVQLLGPPEKKAWADHLGCPYLAFGRDVTAFIDKMKETLSVKAALMFNQFVRQEIRHQFKHLPGHIQGADLVIGSSLVFGLSSVAEKLQIPYRYVAFTPHLFPSRFHPFPALKQQRLPSWLNWLSWKAGAFLNRFNYTALINQFRKKWHLSVLDDCWKHILGNHPIVACDPEVATVPKDVQLNTIQTGFLHLDLPCPVHAELENFLNQGQKPVYAGFGSMPASDQKTIIPMLIRAAQKTGHRLVIGAFWQKDSNQPLAKDLFFIQNYPHLHLFSHMKAVIHHGGAGTTAAATISGVPQIIVPHILDQYYHGNQIHRNGLGPAPIWRNLLTEKNLIHALENCQKNDNMKNRTQKIAAGIQPKQSLKNAVKTIERSP